MELMEEWGEFLPTSVTVPGMFQLQGFPLGKAAGWEWMGVLRARLSHTRALPKLLGQTRAIHPTKRLQLLLSTSREAILIPQCPFTNACAGFSV